jgi:transposase
MRTTTLGSGVYKTLSEEVRSSRQARQQHRLHAVMLVAGGMSCRAVGRLLGDSPRTIGNWVLRYRAFKNTGLFDLPSPGRPARLSAAQIVELRLSIATAPAGETWNGATISALVLERWGVVLGVRQAQRLLSRIRAMREK